MTIPKEEAQDCVARLLKLAVKQGASDIYWIPGHDRMDVRFRREGAQESVAELPAEYGERCVTRIKVLAGLLTYRTRVAQDGVIRGEPETGGAELRVSAMPTSHGERISVRILQNARGPQLLGDLGFPRDTVRALRRMLERPTGLIVLTGPTGSGKTTTIYAMVRELLRQHLDPASILTLEDPIECEIEGISQTRVGESGGGMDYAAALRAALRQDVKTLVVGEMRDKDVVKVTLDAALTGHRIITTYHAGDIPSVYARLLHQGFEPFLIASAITGVVSQRLLPGKDGAARVPVAAVLAPDDAWRDFVAERPGLAELRKEIRKRPESDLDAVVQRMAAEGVLGKEAVRLETEGT